MPAVPRLRLLWVVNLEMPTDEGEERDPVGLAAVAGTERVEEAERVAEEGTVVELRPFRSCRRVLLDRGTAYSMEL